MTGAHAKKVADLDIEAHHGQVYFLLWVLLSILYLAVSFISTSRCILQERKDQEEASAPLAATGTHGLQKVAAYVSKAKDWVNVLTDIIKGMLPAMIFVMALFGTHQNFDVFRYSGEYYLADTLIVDPKATGCMMPNKSREQISKLEKCGDILPRMTDDWEAANSTDIDRAKGVWRENGCAHSTVTLVEAVLQHDTFVTSDGTVVSTTLATQTALWGMLLKSVAVVLRMPEVRSCFVWSFTALSSRMSWIPPLLDDLPSNDNAVVASRFQQEVGDGVDMAANGAMVFISALDFSSGCLKYTPFLGWLKPVLAWLRLDGFIGEYTLSLRLLSIPRNIGSWIIGWGWRLASFIYQELVFPPLNATFNCLFGDNYTYNVELKCKAYSFRLMGSNIKWAWTSSSAPYLLCPLFIIFFAFVSCIQVIMVLPLFVIWLAIYVVVGIVMLCYLLVALMILLSPVLLGYFGVLEFFAIVPVIGTVQGGLCGTWLEKTNALIIVLTAMSAVISLVRRCINQFVPSGDSDQEVLLPTEAEPPSGDTS